jgi:hypothetical protein
LFIDTVADTGTGGCCSNIQQRTEQKEPEAVRVHLD